MTRKPPKFNRTPPFGGLRLGLYTDNVLARLISNRAKQWLCPHCRRRPLWWISPEIRHPKQSWTPKMQTSEHFPAGLRPSATTILSRCPWSGRPELQFLSRRVGNRLPHDWRCRSFRSRSEWASDARLLRAPTLSVDFLAPSTGTFFIDVSEHSNTHTGDYVLIVTQKQTPDEHQTAGNDIATSSRHQ